MKIQKICFYRSVLHSPDTKQLSFPWEIHVLFVFRCNFFCFCDLIPLVAKNLIAGEPATGQQHSSNSARACTWVWSAAGQQLVHAASSTSDWQGATSSSETSHFFLRFLLSACIKTSWLVCWDWPYAKFLYECFFYRNSCAQIGARFYVRLKKIRSYIWCLVHYVYLDLLFPSWLFLFITARSSSTKYWSTTLATLAFWDSQ